MKYPIKLTIDYEQECIKHSQFILPATYPLQPTVKGYETCKYKTAIHYKPTIKIAYKTVEKFISL